MSRSSASPYYEIDINAAGVLYDSRIHNWWYEHMVKHWQAWAHAFDPGIAWAVRVRRDAAGAVTGWEAELAIPFRDLVPEYRLPVPGSTWLFNDAYPVPILLAGPCCIG